MTQQSPTTHRLIARRLVPIVLPLFVVALVLVPRTGGTVLELPARIVVGCGAAFFIILLSNSLGVLLFSIFHRVGAFVSLLLPLNGIRQLAGLSHLGALGWLAINVFCFALAIRVFGALFGWEVATGASVWMWSAFGIAGLSYFLGGIGDQVARAQRERAFRATPEGALRAGVLSAVEYLARQQEEAPLARPASEARS